MRKLLHHDVFGRNICHEHARDEVHQVYPAFYQEQINYPCFLNK